MARTLEARKLILIHGLNNNLQCFYPLREFFSSLGYTVHMITLPGHDEPRENGFNFERASRIFDERISSFVEGSFDVVAFSTGATFYELWEREHSEKARKKIFLAPAFAIRHQEHLLRLGDILPEAFPIKSFMPPFARNRSFLQIREYRTLFSAIDKFSETFEVAGEAKIFLDPKDELVDTPYILRNWKDQKQLEVLERPHLKNLSGQHHMMFWPDYFQPGQHERFRELMRRFLTNSV